MCNKGITVLPATHTRTMPAFTPQLQGITTLWLVLIAPTHEGMARLSWPGWLVVCTFQGFCERVSVSHGADCGRNSGGVQGSNESSAADAGEVSLPFQPARLQSSSSGNSAVCARNYGRYCCREAALGSWGPLTVICVTATTTTLVLSISL